MKLDVEIIVSHSFVACVFFFFFFVGGGGGGGGVVVGHMPNEIAKIDQVDHFISFN